MIMRLLLTGHVNCEVWGNSIMAKATAKKSIPARTKKPVKKAKKAAPARKAASKKAPVKKTSKKNLPAKKSRKPKARKAATKKAADGKSPRKNKLGVENSLVNNINARKKKGVSRTRSESSVTKKAFFNMENI